jgi:hypothetical protein
VLSIISPAPTLARRLGARQRLNKGLSPRSSTKSQAPVANQQEVSMKSLSVAIALILALGLTTQAMAGKADGNEKTHFVITLTDGR